MSQKRDRRRIRRNETNDLEVCTEWVQKWISPNRIRKNKDLSVREIVHGPFSSPKLLRIQPIIEIPSSQQQAIIVNENYNDLRYGIPNTWKEYLVRKGFCNSMEACVLQSNLIPFYVRSFVTDKLWNELGLPLVQGIPDPWKSKSFSERRSVKCLRQQCVYNDSTSSQITCIYDGDDEAEMEHELKTQFNEHHVDNKKDPFQEKNKNEKTIQFQVDQNPKLTSEHKEHKKHKEHEHKKHKGHEIKKHKEHELKKHKEHEHKEPIQKCCSDIQKDTEKIISNTRATNTKRKKKKCNKMIQTKEKLPVTKIDKKSLLQKHKAKTDDVKKETKNHICCNYKHFSEQTTQLEQTNVSNLVLCQKCENHYQDTNLQLNGTAETMDCAPKTNNGSQHKTIDKKKMNKPCSCLKKIKERLMEKNHTASEQEMRFVCGQCNNPYLKIAAVKNTTGQKTNFYNRNNKEEKKIMICVSQCPMTRNQRKNVVPSSKNHCCTFIETKTNISKGDFDQVRRRHSRDNNPSEKNVSGVKFDENAEISTANSTRMNFQNDIKAKDVTQTHEKKIIPITVTADKLHKEEELEDDSSNGKRKMKKRRCRCNNDTMIDDEKCRVKQFPQVRFATTLRCTVSDSGEYADLSDNCIDDGENITIQDRLSVTSISFIQRLKHNSHKKYPIEGYN